MPSSILAYNEGNPKFLPAQAGKTLPAKAGSRKSWEILNKLHNPRDVLRVLINKYNFTKGCRND